MGMTDVELRQTVDGVVLVQAPGFVVTLKDGRRYAANHLLGTFLESGFREPAIAFVCSGKLETVAAQRVASIEYTATRMHCDECDQQFPKTLPFPGEETIELRGGRTA